MAKRLSIALGLVTILLAAGSAGASPRAKDSSASARAFAIRVVVPGQSGAVTAAVSAPPDAVALGAGFAFPADGSIVTSGSVTASASTNVGSTAGARASSEVTSLSLLGNQITADAVSGRATATASPNGATGNLDGSGVSNLVVLGQAVTASQNLRLPLGDWGYLIASEQAIVPGSAPGAHGHRVFVTALHIHLTADHGGLPAGSEIQVGYAEAAAEAIARNVETAPSPRPGAPGGPNARQRRPPEPERPPFGTPPIRKPPPNVMPKLTAGGYVFPVYGRSSFADTFGAPRAGVGWHHGVDIFAPLGAPILAVADGMVFSVGWNDIGGNRLWLRDGQGNEFYYAHLSAFSPLAVDGAYVNAGDVLGFVGDTGDAEGTPYHLHFEIHPVSLLYRGYDGAVNPSPYVTAWKRLQDLGFPAAEGWAPRAAPSSAAPKPGAILLHVSDISSASGLEPGSLEQALAADPAFTEGDGALVGLTGAPTVLRWRSRQ